MNCTIIESFVQKESNDEEKVDSYLKKKALVVILKRRQLYTRRE